MTSFNSKCSLQAIHLQTVDDKMKYCSSNIFVAEYKLRHLERIKNEINTNDNDIFGIE